MFVFSHNLVHISHDRYTLTARFRGSPTITHCPSSIPATTFSELRCMYIRGNEPRPHKSGGPGNNTLPCQFSSRARLMNATSELARIGVLKRSRILVSAIQTTPTYLLSRGWPKFHTTLPPAYSARGHMLAGPFSSTLLSQAHTETRRSVIAKAHRRICLRGVVALIPTHLFRFST